MPRPTCPDCYLATDGETIVIERHGKPAAVLTAAPSKPGSLLGAMVGEFELPEGWDRPLTEKEVDAFWRGKW
jgi:antitoxin (DNA-binding transcriptional repressor) of toxin-antitoxin stability system